MVSPLMRKAVAVWLVDNTILSFEQVADACGLHPLEVQGIADGEVAMGLVGCNPIATGEIDEEDLRACEKDPKRRLRVKYISDPASKKKKKTSVYTPVVRRRVKPDAALWLIENYPELSNGQIVSLIGTTVKIVKAIREKTYWNMKNIKPRDPILFRLCAQEGLDEALLKIRISNESEKKISSMDPGLELEESEAEE